MVQSFLNRLKNTMNPTTVTIISSKRVRQRFTENQIRLFVERSLHKMSECPEQVETWISHYRTIYGEITVVLRGA